MQGRIKLHRQTVERWWYKKPNMFHCFFYLIMKANHKDVIRQWIEVKRWQAIIWLIQSSKDTGISTQSFRTCLKNLEQTWEIIVKSTNKFTIVTIVKYWDFNDMDNETNKQLTNNQQTTNKQLTTNKNDKNKKELKELKESNLYIKGVEDFILFQKDNIPWIRYQIEKQWEYNYLQKQYQAYNKIISTNKITTHNLDRILDFVKQDKFWNKQIGSITKLLDKNKEGVPYRIVMIDKIKTKIDEAPKVFKIEL